MSEAEAPRLPLELGPGLQVDQRSGAGRTPISGKLVPIRRTLEELYRTQLRSFEAGEHLRAVFT